MRGWILALIVVACAESRPDEQDESSLCGHCTAGGREVPDMIGLRCNDGSVFIAFTPEEITGACDARDGVEVAVRLTDGCLCE